MNKYILPFLILAFFCTQIIAAQGGSERPKIDYKSKNVAGIFYYDIDEAVEAMKIKDDEQDYQIAKLLKKHNNKVKKIEFLNTKNFEEVDEMVNGVLNSTPSRNSPPKESNDKEHLRGVIKKVRDELKQEETLLNEKMKELLSDKQNKKWLKHQKQKKRDLLPERPSSSSSGMGRMSRPGFGQPQQGMQQGGMMMR